VYGERRVHHAVFKLVVASSSIEDTVLSYRYTCLLYVCTTVRLYDCTTVRLYDCTTVRLYDCISASASALSRSSIAVHDKVYGE
jgi:hypothetical protein